MESYVEQLTSLKTHITQLQEDFGEFENLNDLHEKVSLLQFCIVHTLRLTYTYILYGLIYSRLFIQCQVELCINLGTCRTLNLSLGHVLNRVVIYQRFCLFISLAPQVYYFKLIRQVPTQINKLQHHQTDEVTGSSQFFSIQLWNLLMAHDNKR